ncbi:bifunctional proline dehydrogenase/L-glutamate gamma-semialdehyde dehydrogenase [Microlunatus sp. Gsoil 973]|uniref:bifunctional proline dehydrogenase/L-glutamate gamma-semialdehyde dehydrogenase n=1 Tax=Microlunatus sp. Gsoil 973 TaxID=2672569 RepID=UPI0012B4BFDC|nr:bifunctional proline dehydrogenase/L-glutamate gamma-semialdehyde dehydrogenase [Microlunatus sp. Gsoil 973]QGN33849.1 aldehyde dehydrogenase family protein [Microlunatus sp. Gsoil 973]
MGSPAQAPNGVAVEEVRSLVDQWIAAAEQFPPDAVARRLAGVLSEDNGLEFTVRFVDEVLRPQDHRVAARGLANLSPIAPRFLPPWMRLAIRAGGIVGRILPQLVVPIARRTMRTMVGHLILDARPAQLGRAIAKLRARGDKLNLNLLGEAVLGDQEADRRLEGTRALLTRPDVDYVSIKVSSVASQIILWSFEETVEKIVARLTPLYETAAASDPPTFINLDMEEYRDLDLTIEAFQRLLDQPSLINYSAGIVLQAYLPDALPALDRLTEWAIARRRRGGAPIKIRVVKGANLAMERVDSAVHGWPLATFGSKAETDANYLRMLSRALDPVRLDAVRIGIAGHNLFDIAYSWLLAQQRGVTDSIDYEMLLGMATPQAAAVLHTVGDLRLYTPVVDPREFDVAIAYLVRRLEENASSENFMSAVHNLGTDESLREREYRRFLESLDLLDAEIPERNRTQDRNRERLAAITEDPHHAGFANVPDTDPSLPANRDWATATLSRIKESTAGEDAIRAAKLTEETQLEDLLRTLTAGAARWAALPDIERSAVLRRTGHLLAARRDELIEVMAAETGKTISESDPEVSEAIDMAHYYAELGLQLGRVAGARFAPARVTAVTPPWNFPVAIPFGTTAAPLATGSAVLLKPAPEARRCSAVFAHALWDAGVPRDVLALADIEEGTLGRELIAHPAVDRVILTGSYETAEMFRSFRPDLPLVAETSGKNAMIITPSADLDLAVSDLVNSAFGHAGQKCSAASLAILVGSLRSSRRFRSQLVDAVTSMRVGYPQDAANRMGPLIGPARGKLLHGLTRLDPGEEWLITPRQLDESGRLWSPGVRAGVRPGSQTHRTEYFGPVLGIMYAADLDEAIELQNAVDYGLTAGLHSLDVSEVQTWMERVQAGNLYVNRGTTGAIIRRQPFGGWKRSSVGTGAKAGGPNYLVRLGRWAAVEDVDHESSVDHAARTAHGGNAVTPTMRLQAYLTAALEALSSDRNAAAWFRRAVDDDARVWAAEFGVSRDVSELGVERNVFRYRPAECAVRIAEGASLRDALRVIAAGLLSRARFTVSAGAPLPDAVVGALADLGIAVHEQSDDDWQQELAGVTGRVRLVGADGRAALAAAGGSPELAIWDDPVTVAGRLELLPFLLEQSVSVTAHRFGGSSPLSDIGI